MTHTYVINEIMWRVIKEGIPKERLVCNKCSRPIGVGDRVGQRNGKFVGFNCKQCINKVLKQSQMN